MTDTLRDPATSSDIRRYQHFIDGKPGSGSGEVIARYSPVSGQVVAEYAAGTEADIDAAVLAARNAFNSGVWSDLPGLARGRALNRLASVLRNHVDELIALDAAEVGTPQRVARGPVEAGIGQIDFAASLASTLHGEIHTNLGPDFTGLLVREPLGVVGLIVPWNFPTLILCQKLGYALAAGCTAVVKPSEFTSGSAVRVAELALEAGIPEGVVNVVTGYGNPVGQRLAEHPDVDLVSFTGSTATGQRVLESSKSNLKRVSLELGGKAAQIVFADADLDDAVEGVLFAAIHNQGECCVAGARLLVEDSVADEFLDRLAKRAGDLRLGGPDDEADLGALIHPDHMRKVLDYINVGVQEGASIRAGGGQLDHPEYAQGCFVQPTILDNVTPTDRVFQEEIFGPVVTVTRFSGADEAIELANVVEYGLGNTVWTKNIDKALTVTRRLHSGTVWVNTTIDGSPQLTFGGYKASGYGREMGKAGFEEYTQIKTIQIRTGTRVGKFGLLS
ncbi:aldehyde dehydrogenase family protein [Saccharopolyspora hattusasensis]|uniref:aldehyde dehydrogenase family protein n=1 Tax=Saccharopolyspora hattusasensis TaxID=1128679 RepID=UPI003D95C964